MQFGNMVFQKFAVSVASKMIQTVLITYSLGLISKMNTHIRNFLGNIWKHWLGQPSEACLLMVYLLTLILYRIEQQDIIKQQCQMTGKDAVVA
jgi:hypothetical protein